MNDIELLESQNKGLKAQNIELQQEINALKAEYKQLNDIIDSYLPKLEELKELNADYAELKAENEWLKKENETLKITREKLLGDLCITEENLKDYEEHYKRSEQQKEKYYQRTLDDEIQINNLLQTLQEIKAIAEIHNYWSSNLKEATEAINKILDLITKVEEE